MRLALNPDQETFATFLGQILASTAGAFRPVPGWGRFEYGAALDTLLDEQEFYDAAAEETLGPVMAAEMVSRLAELPVVVECAASALLRPLILPELPRPVAVIDGDTMAPIRFLPVAKSVVRLSDDAVHWAEVREVEEVESLFAYPMGRLAGAVDWTPVETNPTQALDRWRVGVAAEIAGSLKGGLDAVLAHVRDRHQFGRPLGSFQGVQHRLATDAVNVESARLLALKAAYTGATQDATVALAHAQRIATRIGYDLHQFMGAMGLTLEHPLHRWTYRVRLLRSALGGADQTFRHYADARWGPA